MTTKRRTRRRGFTLLELMVALMITGLVVAAVFTLGGASARHFQEQQRIGVTQRSVRLAMDRVRRDVARAGYLGVVDSEDPDATRMCPRPIRPRPVRALWFEDDHPAGNAALDGVNRAANRVSADRIRMVGNYSTGDAYLVRTFDGTGNTVFLQTDWLGFRRSFVNGSGPGATVDGQRYAAAFQPGRMLHIETPSGFHILTYITASNVNTAGTTASITINPGVGIDNPCLRGLGRGSIVSPLSEVEYFVGSPNAGSSLVPRNQAVTGPNTILYRRELDMTTNGAAAIPGTVRPVLEFAIDFNLDFVVDNATDNPTQPPDIRLLLGADAQAPVRNNASWVRGAVISLAARTPEQDRRYPWPEDWGTARPDGAPLNRFLVFPGQDGAARVRQLRSEVLMTNLVPR